MTVNQLAYWQLQEERRSNQAKELETNRANVAKETETTRHNKASENADLIKAQAAQTSASANATQAHVAYTLMPQQSQLLQSQAANQSAQADWKPFDSVARPAVDLAKAIGSFFGGKAGAKPRK